MEKEKLNFWSRLKKSIFNLEKYSEFVNEKLSTTIKFLCLFVLIFVIFQTAIYGIYTYKTISKVEQYISNNLSDFEYKDNSLNAMGISTAYDEENDFYFAMDTKNPDQIDNYRNEMKKHSMGMVLAEKDAYVYSGGSEIVYTYSQLTEGMPSETLSKAKLIERLQGNAKIELLTVVLGVILIANYPATLVAYALQILAVALAVYITGKIMIIKLNFKGSFSIATYSMVLSSIFSMVYTVINTFTEFRTVNFDLMYNIIIYIYAMFAVFMIKIDEMKQQEEIIKEVRKIEKVQEEVPKEMKAAKEVEEQVPEQEIKEEQEKSEETEKVESEVEEKAETKEESEEAKEVTEEKNENPIEKPSKKGKGKKK